MLTDTHAHLFFTKDLLENAQFSYEDDLDQVLKEASENNISTILNVGVDLKTSQVALDQLSTPLFKNSGINFYSSIGIHPEEAIKYNGQGTIDNEKLTKAIKTLEGIYDSNPEKVIAVGEVGLDYLIEAHPEWSTGLSFEEIKQLQKQLFLAQINLAKKLNLPLLIHVRDNRTQNPENTDCWNDVIDLSKDHFGIYHCYSGMGEITHRILEETKFLISLAGNLTYPKNDYLREACKIIPLNRIVLETDCPFLPPQSMRGQRNEPSSIREIAELVAQIKGTSLEEVADQTSQNFKEFLNL